ncbi:tRNA:m(4)X modification enzyme TRM13 homolog [Spea bombifrons]|uniref:tRNA:m(4)X modification enzyme TRM13 homolog n=1 Tax=Spea bombifrons TaxID=233779 RepID=UPI00234AC582|nr:tRNA:m(4)X modification enzyme TRM13 homolog [Spea bombifrons]
MEMPGPPLPEGTHREPCKAPCPSENPIAGRCSYFVQRKRRFCKMVVSEGKKFCGEHAENGEEQGSKKRIPCPLDPKHTVYQDQLQKHLKKCNSREKPQPVFYVRDLNAGPLEGDPCEKQVAISALSREDLQTLTETLKRVTNDLELPLPDKKLCHSALDEALSDPVNGESAAKHLKQQGSILGHLDSLGLLGGSLCFVEFGAGRGKLSHWVDIATENAENVHFLLVERATTRFKVDGKQRNSTFERLHIDIQHLCLGKVPSLVQKQLPVIGIGKHLCGAGTDLALRCLMQAHSSPLGEPQCKRSRMNPDASNCAKEDKSVPSQQNPVAGIVIALCCHHRCDWQHYVGREFFQNLGLGQREFNFFQRMSSWATCGTRKSLPDTSHVTEHGETEGREDEDDDGGQRMPSFNSETVQGLLSVEERENLGRLCKLLIDRGRVDYLRRMGYEAALQYYTDPEVSLENVLLTALPNTSS